jgi:hypothetical protein
MALIKLHKYQDDYPKTRQEIFINPDHITMAEMARTEDPRPGTRLIFSNGTEVKVWENMVDFIPAASEWPPA